MSLSLIQETLVNLEEINSDSQNESKSTSENEKDKREKNNIYISCPNCTQTIEVVEMNCRIFRCGIMKNTFEQINPHLSKIECDRLKEDDLIYGCGKPFQILIGETEPIICEYI